MSATTKVLSLAVLMALGATASAANNDAAVQRALGLIKAQASSGDDFAVRDVVIDSDGTEHVRFDMSYKGLPVIGGDAVVHSRNGQLQGISRTLNTNARGNPQPHLRADDAITAAGVEFGVAFEGVPTASLAYYARGTGNAMTLAYDVTFAGERADQTATEMHYIVDARTGRILDRWDNIHTAKPGSGGGSTSCTTSANGTGYSLFSGNVSLQTSACSTGGFQLRDQTRGGGYTTNMANSTRGSGTIFSDADNLWGNGSNSDAASAAADASFSVATTWDYYKLVHGRSGIANDGKGALSKIHYGRSYVNAFWSDSCFCMTYGDGDGVNYAPLVTLDIAGHEMSHGVTSRSANLTYSGESGGLNEATSDIFGTLVEFYANNVNDPGDYLVGEKIYIKYPAGNKGLRYMDDPIKDGQSPSCYKSTLGSLDVHYSSGVANHFFYLLAEGSGSKTFNGVLHNSPTCNSSNVTGIGRDKAGKIWYRALTVYMTSSTNYAGARAATLNAASDLYGASSAERNAVAAAWSAVSVN